MTLSATLVIGSLPLDTHERFEPGDLPRQVRVIRRVDHLADILIRSRRFLGDSAERRASNQNSSCGELFDDVATVPLPKRLMPAHAPTGSVAGGSIGQRHTLLGAREDIRGRSHGTPDQHRLSYGS